MKDIDRRLARLEAASAQRRAMHYGDHGLSSEEYAAAYAELTRLLSTPATEWPAGALAAFKAGCPAHLWAKYGTRLDALLVTEPGGAP